MKVPINKITKLFSPDLTFPMYSYAAWAGYGLACHVAGSRGELGDTQPKILICLGDRGHMADRPGGDVIVPGIPVAGLGSRAVLRVLATHRA